MAIEIDTDKYETYISEAVAFFWDTRQNQQQKQKENGKEDYGSRGAVTGGKQLDKFVELLSKIAIDNGVPASCISTKNNVLPCFFRPTKDWDFIITSKEKLLCAIELKSQVGSFGNNFNNRTEEALGAAVDFWTAHRKETFKQSFQPWLGYFMLLEKTDMSSRKVSVMEPHFPVRNEFYNTSYMDRYNLFCQKLMSERHYTEASIMWTSDRTHYGEMSIETSFKAFISAFIGFLLGKKDFF